VLQNKFPIKEVWWGWEFNTNVWKWRSVFLFLPDLDKIIKLCTAASLFNIMTLFLCMALGMYKLTDIICVLHIFKLYIYLIDKGRKIFKLILFRAWHYSRLSFIKPAVLSTLFHQRSRLRITQLHTQLIWNMNSTSCNNKPLFATLFTVIAGLLRMTGVGEYNRGLVDPQLPSNLKWRGLR
jgi:hypothetical protein